MAKLSTIFENIYNKDGIKQKYYAQKIVEHFTLLEGKQPIHYDITFIENHIINTAFKKNSLEESLLFVDGVFEKIDEGFMSGLKNLTSKAWNGVKKIAGKIKDAVSRLWNGPSIDVIKEWNTTVTSAANKLDGLTESVLDNTYLFEEETTTSDDTIEDTPLQPEEDEVEGDGEEGNEYNVTNLLDMLFTKATMPSPLQTHLPIKDFKFFSVMKDPDTQYRVLSFSDKSDGIMIPLIKVQINKKLIFSIPSNDDATGIEVSVKVINLIKTLINNIRNDERFKLEEIINDEQLEKANKLIKISFSGKSFVIKPGMVMTLKNDGTEEEVSTEDTTSTDTSEDDSTKDNTISTNTTTDEKSTPEIELPPSVLENKKIIEDAISLSSVKNNIDGFYDRLGITSDDTWQAFYSFAKNNNYRITSILKNTDGNLNNAKPLSEGEYFGYIANMKPFINSLREQPIQNGYNKDAYKVFLNSVLLATDKLSEIVNRDMDISSEPTTETNTDAKSIKKTKDDMISIIDGLSNDDLKYILSKVN